MRHYTILELKEELRARIVDSYLSEDHDLALIKNETEERVHVKCIIRTPLSNVLHMSEEDEQSGYKVIARYDGLNRVTAYQLSESIEAWNSIERKEIGNLLEKVGKELLADQASTATVLHNVFIKRNNL